MKGLSVLVSVVLLIAITFFIALIIDAWTRGFVTEMLTESYSNYKKTVGSVIGSLINLYK